MGLQNDFLKRFMLANGNYALLVHNRKHTIITKIYELHKLGRQPCDAM